MSGINDLAVPDLARRFSGLERLYGFKGATRIRAAHMVIVGIGGVGSWAAEAFVRSGVGEITLIDMDHVSESNINRQAHAVTETVGRAKVLAMRDRMLQINPSCRVHCIEEFVNADNWNELLPPTATAVMDACDQMHAKFALAAWRLKSARNGLVFISIGAAGGKRLGHMVEIDDLSEVTHDPLLAKLRYLLRKTFAAQTRAKKKMGLNCVFSREAVQLPGDVCAAGSVDSSLNCHGYGSSVSVTATFGQCAAGWVMDQVAQKTEK